MSLSSAARRALLPPLLPFGVALIAVCSSQDHGPRPPGGQEGEIKIYTATYEDGRDERQFFLKVGDEETRLIFDAAPDVLPGTDVVVWGKDQDDGLHVTNMRVE